MINHSRRSTYRLISTHLLAAAVALCAWLAIREPQTFTRRVEQLAARRVHTPEVAGSSPASATRFDRTARQGGMREPRRFRSSPLHSVSLTAITLSPELRQSAGGVVFFRGAFTACRALAAPGFFLLFTSSLAIWSGPWLSFYATDQVTAIRGLSYFLENL
jgi:hypothetical protein